MADLEPLVDVAESLATFDRREHIQRVDGVKVLKLWADLDRYAHIIDRTRPQVLVETGSRYGGSALWFAQRGVHVISIDLDLRRSVAASSRCHPVGVDQDLVEGETTLTIGAPRPAASQKCAFGQVGQGCELHFGASERLAGDRVDHPAGDAAGHEVDADLLGRGRRPDHVDGGLHHHHQVRVADAQSRPAAHDPRHVQEVLDERRLRVRVALDGLDGLDLGRPVEAP